MKTYNSSILSAILLSGFIALASLTANAANVKTAIRTSVAAIDTGKMQKDKMKMEKKKMDKKKGKMDKMAKDTSGKM